MWAILCPAVGSMSAETPITLTINPQDLQVQTFTVEKLLEPLIIQVTTLVNCPQNPSNRKKGRSKRARVLLASVEEATWNLLDKGEKIAQEATALKEELTGALQEVRKESDALKESAERFADDPCYLPKREAVVQAARALLAAVTRLLILADMIDVMCLLQHVSAVSKRWLRFTSALFSLLIPFSFFFFCFLGLHLWHMEILRLEVKLELQLLAYTIATAMPDRAASATYTITHSNSRSLTH
uniref:Catenin alpha-3 n=1 Tax=Sus scrofa TaxID=9823 RepID=A0A8D1RW77_PIG